MKIIPSLAALEQREDNDLVEFIRKNSPWLEDKSYNAEQQGYTFILSGLNDVILCQKLCLVPHVPLDDDYRQDMTIDFNAFDQWEYATRDETTGYYQAVLVMGNSGFGANVIMSADFVRSVHQLKNRLEQLLEESHVE